jgi:hypothetical protein
MKTEQRLQGNPGKGSTMWFVLEGKQKTGHTVWTLADILAVWPDCATSSAFTYSNRQAKVSGTKSKDLAHTTAPSLSKKSSAECNYFRARN